MIEARRTRRDELRPAGGQLFQDIAIDDIVDDTLTAGNPAANETVPRPRRVSK